MSSDGVTMFQGIWWPYGEGMKRELRQGFFVSSNSERRSQLGHSWANFCALFQRIRVGSSCAARPASSFALRVALPCAPVKRSRLLPEVLDDCSALSRRLSSREKAIIREMTETVLALNFLETGGIVGIESREKVRVLHMVRRLGITCTSSSPLSGL